MEDLYFKVTASVLNIRSSGNVADNDLGAFNLVKDDIIHAVEKVVPGSTFHRFDAFWRNGIKYVHPFTNAPSYVSSPTGQYWTAEKGEVSGVWLEQTTNPEPPPPTEKTFIANVVIRDPKTGERWGWENQEMPKLP